LNRSAWPPHKLGANVNRFRKTDAADTITVDRFRGDSAEIRNLFDGEQRFHVFVVSLGSHFENLAAM
jgi:hypothetical protein